MALSQDSLALAGTKIYNLVVDGELTNFVDTRQLLVQNIEWTRMLFRDFNEI